MSQTPDYILTEDFNCSADFSQTKILSAGTFVRPIQFCYVPKHVLESKLGKFFNPKMEMFCYTRLGIVPIPKNIVRQA